MPSPPPAVLALWVAAVQTGDMALPMHYPQADRWESLQSGFRSHGITGESLTGTQEGAWQPGWHVVALNGFDDPFFIDLEEEALSFPVYYAPHGAGRWDATPVAPSLQRFGDMLRALAAYGEDDAAALQWLQAHTENGHLLWDEVKQTRLERMECARQDHDSALAPAEGPALWQRGELVLLQVGPAKLKVVHALRQALELTPQQALQRIAHAPALLGTETRGRLRRLETTLESLGAVVEFRPATRPDAPADTTAPLPPIR